MALAMLMRRYEFTIDPAAPEVRALLASGNALIPKHPSALLAANAPSSSLLTGAISPRAHKGTCHSGCQADFAC